MPHSPFAQSQSLCRCQFFHIQRGYRVQYHFRHGQCKWIVHALAISVVGVAVSACLTVADNRSVCTMSLIVTWTLPTRFAGVRLNIVMRSRFVGLRDARYVSGAGRSLEYGY